MNPDLKSLLTSATPARLALAGLALWGGLASAHVALEPASAPAGSSYRAAFRVGHGCDGWPTTGITVLMPVGVQGAKPMPKPGWTLATRTDTLATPYASHGKTVTEDVAEVSWVAQTPQAALPDAHYDEFVLRVGLPAQAGPLWFKVVQTCGDGQQQRRTSWDQVPAAGTSTKGLKTPAVLLRVESPAPAPALAVPAPAHPGHVHH